MPGRLALLEPRTFLVGLDAIRSVVRMRSVSLVITERRGDHRSLSS